MAIDPYRVLGLPAGASTAEVKRAYRRLAKANHPDSAGESALARFLEIQRAYEQLTTATWRPGIRRPSSGGAAEPWRADPMRARSTPGEQPPGGTSGRSPGGPTSSRAGGGSGPGRPGSTGGRAAGGGSPGSGQAHRGPAGASAGTAAGASAGSRSGSGTESRTDGPSGRRRHAKKATFGSTTYDEAHDHADTTWSGASWYGQTSGEYWRVNPREYADPRKHGPEYMSKAAARAAAAAERRARQDAASSGATAGATPGPDPRTRPQPGASGAARGGDTTSRGRASVAPPPRRTTWTPPSPHHPDGASSTPGAGANPAIGPAFDLSPGMRRLLRAVVAWPPLGIAAAAVIGEATGCAAFEAICTPPADLYPWFAQVAIILALLAVPGAARVLAGGTLAVAILAFPVAAVLLAGGANYDRRYGPAALIAVLAVVWAVGVAAVLLRRVATRWLP